ncbi:MAG: gliding motility-associated C-terminal domain-containing protein [Bacteroidota bacterium]
MDKIVQAWLKTVFFLLPVIWLFPFYAAGEGTKQLLPDSTISGAGLYIDNAAGSNFTKFGVGGCPANYRLYIHVKNAGEYILFGFQSAYANVPFTLRKPNGTVAFSGIVPYLQGQTGYITYYHQAIVGPYPASGRYSPLSYHVTSIADTGNYYFEIPASVTYSVTFDLWDFQVVTGLHSPAIPADAVNGRVWSQSWQVYASLGFYGYDYQPFNGSFFIYADDGIVSKLVFSNAAIGVVTVFCNPYGCLNTGNFTSDRQSKNVNTFSTYPAIAQYKVFLNDPDSTLYPSGVYGAITGTPTLVPDPGYPLCSGKKYVVVTVNKSGWMEVDITLPYGGSATKVTLFANVVPGVNNIPWNGLDGLGNAIPDGTLITVNIHYMNGLTNLPVWDQEENPDGYIITGVRPANISGLQPISFWDDSQLVTNTSGDPCNNPPQTTNLTGCTPGSMAGYAGCHPWQPADGYCHNKMINTWWYGSTSNTSFTALYTATVPSPAGHGATRCGAGTLLLHVTVLPNETADWYALPSGGSPILAGDTSFTTPLISVTTTYYAQARNGASGCQSAARIPVTATINPLPVPTITGPLTACQGSDGNVYSTEPGKSGYSWFVSPGGTITAGGGASSNTVTVTWNTPGVQTVSVNYTSPLGCPGAAPTLYAVTVNPLPVPVITGSNTACAGIAGNTYSTQPGMSAYSWTISPGGVVTAGGTSSSNSVTVTWTVPGTQTVTVNYTSGFGCAAVSATIFTITVNPLPSPSLTGPASLCAGTPGNLYATQAGMTSYAWIISPGGTLTSGGTTASNTATVTWNTPGNQTVSVNYANGSGCQALTPVVYPVTVNPLPLPAIAGPATLCAGTAGNTYSTQPGMSGYLWTVSPGGVVTAGGTSSSNTVTVTWSAPGVQSVSVNYLNSFGCAALSATIFNVTVNPLPVPSLTGPSVICTGASGNLYATDAGMSGYSWNISTGGIVTAGGTSSDNTVTVTWTIPGVQTVSVNYTNSSGCAALSATIFNVAVNPLPVPTLAGPSALCAGATGNIYTTEAGKTNYSWNISAGGTITAGGTATSNTVAVTWNSPGSQSVSVTYTDANGCTAANPATFPVYVNPLPVPTISGPVSPCQLAAGNVYNTEPGMSGYLWTVSTGGVITSGASTNSISVTWNAAGSQSVSVLYTDPDGCTAVAPVTFLVTVNPLPGPTGVISGPTPLCAGAQGLVYSVPPASAALNYAWTLPPGFNLVSGAGTSSILVNLASNAASGNLQVYASNQCGSGPSSPLYPVAVNTPPSGNAGPDGITCQENSFTVTQASAINYSQVHWTASGQGTLTGSNSLSPNYMPAPGEYGLVTLTMFVAGNAPCPDETSGMTLDIKPAATARAGNDLITCGQNPVLLSGSSASNYGSLYWTTSGSGAFSDPSVLHPDYTPAISDVNAGSVLLTLHVTSAEPCKPDSGSLTLTIRRRASAFAGAGTSICQGQTFTINQAAAHDYSSLTWSTAGDGVFSDPNVANPDYTPGNLDIVHGSVVLTLNAEGLVPCPAARDSLVLDIQKRATVQPGPDGVTCQGNPFQVSGVTAANYQSITWTTSGKGTLTGTAALSPVYHPAPGETGSITFTLTVAGQNSCHDSTAFCRMALTIYPQVMVNAGKDTIVGSNTSALLDAQPSGGSGNYHFQWEPALLVLNDTARMPQTITLTKDTLFIVTVTDRVTGCSASDSVRIHVSGEAPHDCLVLYNFITPNGDGVNDTWIIDCIENYPANTVQIFDRWGDRVNSFDGYNNTTQVWNGTNAKGALLPDGTYYYVLTIKNEKTRTGWVFLRSGIK